AHGPNVPAMTANRAVAAVVASPAGQAFSFFPSHAGRARCRISEGGPRRRSVGGVCTTDVRVRPGHRRQTLVVFTETWAWRLFHYSGDPPRRQRHVWTFVVLRGRRTKLLHQGGDFPPQWVR
ncbi:MAG TPA: hypothetical protein VE269_01230, partial [Gaiellaceae bacterium]|nr:hypothetical protein [Gaiellaceae bacterium]